MKKNYIFVFILFAFCSLSVLSQSVTFQVTDVSNGTGVIANNSVFYRNTTASSMVDHTFEIKNISAVTQSISVRRYDDVVNTVSVNDKAEANFCTGTTCYGTGVMTSVMTLTTNQIVIFKADLIEASAVGLSEIRYKFSNPNNGSEAITTTIKYNHPLSVKDNASLFNNVSNIYPNPTSSKSYVNVTSLGEENSLNVTIINALGATVSSKVVEVSLGKNIISLDSENLNSGIYFVSISSGNQKITKKITISK
jgi:hypothetical protein